MGPNGGASPRYHVDNFGTSHCRDNSFREGLGEMSNNSYGSNLSISEHRFVRMVMHRDGYDCHDVVCSITVYESTEIGGSRRNLNFVNTCVHYLF